MNKTPPNLPEGEGLEKAFLVILSFGEDVGEGCKIFVKAPVNRGLFCLFQYF
jgi:hypothetical protein